MLADGLDLHSIQSGRSGPNNFTEESEIRLPQYTGL
jgi:hypothetical protein